MTGADEAEPVVIRADDWAARLRAATDESVRRRAARVTARRERLARREAGLALRHAWRQTRLDARAVRRDDGPPADPPG